MSLLFRLYWEFMLRLAMGLCLASALLGAGRETVLIDTDSGLFGDDGAALVMLMRSPSLVNVAGVTVVSGNVWAPQGAEYMLHILDLLKKPLVQVYTGAASPLVHSPAMVLEAARRWGRQEFIGAFGDDPAEVKPAPGSKLNARKAHHEGAVEFLISQIERHPGEITILAIGPMTNIALALKLHPEIETKIKRIVFMGGNVQATGNASAAAEFNFWFDPEAARIVLRSRIPQKVMFTLDICNTAPLRKPEFDQIAAAHTPITELFKEDLGNRYPGFLKRPAAVGYMWDSLAAAFLIDPGFVTRAEVRYVDVLAVWGRFYGSTVPLDRRTAPDATPVTLITEIDLRRVFTLYKDLLTRPE
jgi:inosine-uridine nucleoside N-ribohydrolase